MEITGLLGKRLCELRLAAGLTQDELGAASGLAPATICNIERGACCPAIRRLPALAEALHVDIHELFYFGKETQ